MDYAKESLKLHYKWQGKIEVVARPEINDRDDLSLCYTPGVAQPCLEIQKDESLSYKLTRRGNLVAVITDGTAVLGLIILMVLGLLAGLAPAIRAMDIKPVDAMREE